ncbi:odorant receptor 94b-like [Armigeres subalbatus]|uniref:odorant receptor 94b-like n=1 Tax=Armigeres subalbatus TaxID=124917 RepID=UPI002ED56B78
MNPVIKTLQRQGFWKRPDHTTYSGAQAVGLIVVAIVWLVMPEVIFILRQETNFFTIMRNLAEIFTFGIVVPQASIFLSHRVLLECTYTEVQSTLDTIAMDSNKDVQRILKGLNKFSDRIFKGYIGGEAFVAIPYFLSVPFTVVFKYLYTGVLPALRGILESDYFLFDYQANIRVWSIVTVLNSIVIIYCVSFFISSHSFYWSLLNNVSGLFEIISLKIHCLNEITEESLHRKRLAEIIEVQEVAYRSARALEKSLNVFVLILYGMCIFNVCMTMVILSFPNSDQDLLFKMLLLLVYLLFHIFVYSMLGTELMSTSAATADAFYATHWYMRSVNEQRLILFALARSQKMATLTTGKYFEVGRNTFGMALQTSMSYFAVLRQVYSNK